MPQNLSNPALLKCRLWVGGKPLLSGTIVPANPKTDSEVKGCSTDAAEYYEALRISAQQQLSQGTVQPQLSVCYIPATQ